jgi:carbon storage regulator
MLVLSRKPGERIVIDGSISLMVLGVSGDRVRLGFEAPPRIPILREEIGSRPAPERRASTPRTAAHDPDRPAPRVDPLGLQDP